MIPGSANPLLLKSAGGLQIERSIRLNSADSAYLNRTYGSPTTQNTFTWAGWVKLGILSTTRHLFGVSTNHSLGFTTGDALNLTFGGTSALTTTTVFRDPSAWYHIVWTQSGTSHTLYVNNVSVGTATATSSVFNTAVAHQIGAANTANYFNGYLTNIHFIDGQALTPSSFTETDATTGQLIPKTYTGSYGTNGFNLLFADNSSNTAATLGKDTSPNGNNFTPNNFSVTAGVGNDSLVDSPTNYGTHTGVGAEVRGNYCTWSPLDLSATTLANGNLQASGANDFGSVNGTIAVSSGKYYWEVTASASNGDMIGLWSTSSRATSYPGATADSYGYNQINGYKYNNGSASAYGATFSSGDVIGVALNMDAGTLVFYKNGVSQGTAFSSLTGSFRPSVRAGYTGNPSTGTFANFGQRAFAYTAPSGFKALCTQNLPEGTITTSGSFTGNANADGPVVYLNGVPTAMTINSNAVTFATHADKLSNGFKLRTSSSSYNTAGSNTYLITTTGSKFKFARAQTNP